MVKLRFNNSILIIAKARNPPPRNLGADLAFNERGTYEDELQMRAENDTEPADSPTHNNNKTVKKFKALKAATSKRKALTTVSKRKTIPVTPTKETPWTMTQEALLVDDEDQTRNEHALIICTVMSTPEILEKLSKYGGSIAAVKLSADDLKGDAADVCLRPMCSLTTTTTLSGSLNSSCQLLKDEMSLYNNIPLLFAEAYKWKEIYVSRTNRQIYESGKVREINKLFRSIMQKFQKIFNSYKRLIVEEKPKPSVARPVLIAFPKFENRAKIQLPKKSNEIASKTTVTTLICLLLILGLSITTSIIGFLKMRRDKVK